MPRRPTPREYFAGQEVRGTFTFRNADTGLLEDPTTVTISVLDPDGNQNDYEYGTDSEVVRDKKGVYRFIKRYELSDPSGEYTMRGHGAGLVHAAVEIPFEILDSSFK